MKRLLSVVIVLCAALAMADEADGFNSSWGEGWRFRVGPQFNFGAKGRLGVKSSAIPLPASSYSSTRAAAQDAGDAMTSGSGRMSFPNGAFIDPVDAAGQSGSTWNWYIPAGQSAGGTMSFSTPYSEQSTSYSARGGSDGDDAFSAGASFGLDRTVWAWGDFGLDVGFDFSFFRRNNWFKGSSGGYTRTDVYSEGAYVTDVNFGNAALFADPWAQNAGGSYGAGTFDGPGPVLSLGGADGVRTTHRWEEGGERRTVSSGGLVSLRGDLQMYEFQLALKPYYEVTDWFALRGTLGVGLDHRRFDVSASGIGRSSEHDWNCYMVCGLGGMFRWERFCLGADFLRKVFDHDMDVDTKYVRGSVGNANWTLRAYVGYEF